MTSIVSFGHNDQFNLLADRNSLLAEQNTQLLHRLDAITEQYQSYRTSHQQILIDKNENERFYNVISFFFEHSYNKYKQFQNHPKYSSTIALISQANKQSNSNTEKVNNLIQLTSFLMVQHFGQRNKEQSQKLKEIEAKLRSRQLQRNNRHIQSQLCIVKDPSHSLQFMKQQKSIKEDVFYLTSIYQKCVFTLFGQQNVKKIQKFQIIAMKIKNLMIQRWQSRRIQANLALLQRELQINRTGQSAIVQTIGLLQQSRKKLNKIKNQIDSQLKRITSNDCKFVRC